MSKVDILRLDSVTTNDTTATALINTNFQSIQTALENTLSRDGTVPNYMDAVLDMNSNRIINLGTPVDDHDVVTVEYLNEKIGDIDVKVVDAQEAAQAAYDKAINAAASATSAATSAQQSADKAAEAAAAESNIETLLADPNLVAVGEDLRDEDSYIKAAVAAAETILSTDYGVDLSFTDNDLQLLDQNGDELGNAVTFAAVATSGSYNDLSNTPSIPAAQVNSDWNAVSGVAQILNKPAIPSDTNDLTNGAGYITSSALEGYQTTSNLVTSISSASTDTQYPSAKCVYDIIGDIETVLATI